MAKITKTMNGFFLRASQKEGFAPLYLTVRKSGICLTISTGIEVDIKAWLYAIQKTQRWNEYSNTEDGRRVSDLMEKVKFCADEFVSRGVSDSEVYRRAFRDIVSYKEYLETEKACMDNLDHIIAFYEYFVDGIESGLFKHREQRYKANTIKRWKEFSSIITKFCKPHDTFDDIDKLYAARFNQYLENLGLLKQTANIHIGMMRKLCNMAAELGKNNNPASLNVWKSHRVDRNDVKTSIYLTEMELDELYKMKLDGRNELTRDIFFMGYLSWQRYSDYSTLSKANFKTNDAGVPVIAVTQQKTGNYVEIPMVDERIESICRKYNYSFPELNRTEANERLKVIMKKLADIVPSMNEKFVTILSVSERRSEQHFKELCEKKRRGESFSKNETHMYYWLGLRAYDKENGILFERNEKGEALKPKYMLCTTHTSRRSSVTNAYKSGIFDSRELMSMSGHSTEKIMLNYIKIGTSEQARRVYEKMKDAQKNKTRQKAGLYRMAM